MFDFVRTYTRSLRFVLVLLIFRRSSSASRATRFAGGGNEAVASVDGHGITQAEWMPQRGRWSVRRQMPGVDAKACSTRLR